MEKYLFFVLGLFLLVYGSKFFVEYSLRVARIFRLNTLAFGAVVVSIGTSLPELGVSIDSGLNKLPDVIVGNVIGSNIANVGLILGIALVFSAIRIKQEKIHREADLMLVSSFVFVALIHLGIFNWVFGLLLLIISGFLINNLIREKDVEVPEFQELKIKNLPLSSLVLMGGLAAVLFGSKLTVDGAIEIARSLNVPLRVIAATAIAAGTSLPELAVTIMAVRKKETALAIGNIIGSNLFNMTLVGGTGALFVTLDGSVRLVSGVFFILFALLAYVLVTGKLKPARYIGGILLALYLVFIVYIYAAG